MNEHRLLQTALEMGKEYSNRLNQMAEGYEYLSGRAISADDMDFWGTKEVQKIETLASFWWGIHKFNDPMFFDDGIGENYYEEN